MVIVQVKRKVRTGSLDIDIPGYLVDGVVVDAEQWQVCTRKPDPSLGGEVSALRGDVPVPLLNERQVISRRAALAVRERFVINLSYGIGDGVASILVEEGMADRVAMTTEQELIVGVSQGGAVFGCLSNLEAIVEAPSSVFDFSNGGGLDLSCFGVAQVYREGKVNSSRSAGNAVGCGGFSNIS